MDIRIIEVPFELAAGTVGASLGVEALKAVAIAQDSDFFWEHERDSVAVGEPLLYPHNLYDYARYIDQVTDVVKKTAESVAGALKAGCFPVVLAGDHSTAVGSIAGVINAYPDAKIGVIWIDAHTDLNSPFTTTSGNVHGMSLAAVCGIDNYENKRQDVDEETTRLWENMKELAGAGKVKLEDVVFLGTRDIEEEEALLVENAGLKIYQVTEFQPDNIEKKLEQALLKLDHCDKIYVSFDVDSLDPSVSVGTGTPVEGGFKHQTVKSINKVLVSNEKVCCWEMAEINPLLDHKNRMAESGFDILQEVVLTIKKR